MAKDEFDFDFDFEEDFGFDANSFLSDEDEDIDFSDFGASPRAAAPKAEEDDFSGFNFDDFGLSEKKSDDFSFGGEFDSEDFDMGDFSDADFDGEDFDIEGFGTPAPAKKSGADMGFDFDLDGLDLDGFDSGDFTAEDFGADEFGAEDFDAEGFDAEGFDAEDFGADAASSQSDAGDDFDAEDFLSGDFSFDFEEEAQPEPQQAPQPPVYEAPAYGNSGFGGRVQSDDDSFEEEDFFAEEESYDEGPELFAPRAEASPQRGEPQDYDAADFDEDDFEDAVYGRPVNRPAQPEEPAYEQPSFEEQPQEEAPLEDVPQEETVKPVRPPRRKPEKPARPPRQKTGPSFIDKVLAYYLAPLKEEAQPQDPDNPRRRRRKRTKAQLFKEVYLPPILAGVTLVLIICFVIGSISNAIAQKKLDNEAAMRESQSAAEEEARVEEEAQRVLAEADRLAMGYDYQRAVEVLESYSGELTQEMNEKRAEYVTAQTRLVEWKDYSSIPNLSFHVLIADPARAFADKDLGGQYNRNFVTIDEFTKILDQLYKGGYVLVDFDSFTENSSGVNGYESISTKSIYLPEGKKPVMITETMVNYFGYMVDSNDDGEPDAGGAGFAYRLIVDEKGDIRAQMVDANGQTQTGNYDLVPILEDFIKEHPDFSYQGARATLAVSGSEGVFGYRTNTSYISSVSQGYYDEQVAGAKTVVERLRQLGYTIACYTYGNVAYGDKSATQIQADLKDWTNQITPVIGDVDVLVYARTSDIGDYGGAKFQVLSDSGFRFFVRHGSEPYAEINNTYVRQSRLMVTGENMAWNSNQFSNYFDCAAILNNTRGNVPKG